MSGIPGDLGHQGRIAFGGTRFAAALYLELNDVWRILFVSVPMGHSRRDPGIFFLRWRRLMAANALTVTEVPRVAEVLDPLGRLEKGTEPDPLADTGRLVCYLLHRHVNWLKL